MVMALALLVLSALIFTGALHELSATDVALARVAILVGTAAVMLLGFASVVFGVVGLGTALRGRQSVALPLAGFLASLVGVLLWLIATVDTLCVIFSGH
jgi:hypothetical protein